MCLVHPAPAVGAWKSIDWQENKKKAMPKKKRLGDSLQECAESFLDKPNALFVSLFSHFFFDALEFLDIGTFNRHSFLPKQFDERHDHQQQ